jgi:hypothetical protein
VSIEAMYTDIHEKIITTIDKIGEVIVKKESTGNPLQA